MLKRFTCVSLLLVGLTLGGGVASAVAAAPCTPTSLGTTFNPCVSLDLSQVKECDSTGCYKYCAGRYLQKKWCPSDRKYHYVKVWYRYKVGGSMPSICLG